MPVPELSTPGQMCICRCRLGGMDPALGRIINRDKYFAHYTPDHIIVTMGADPSVLRGQRLLDISLLAGEQHHNTGGDWKIELVDKKGQ